ncbi:MAG: hypothetical protein WCV88_01435 [Patescibacteria group bacterium]|jgi:hypothetical protein
MTRREIPRAEILDRENQEIIEAARLAEQAAVFLSNAEEGAHTSGDTAALARLAYQLHKGGIAIAVSKLLAEIKQRVTTDDRITIPQRHDRANDRDWELMDIGAWQYLAGDTVSAEQTLQVITDPTIQIDMLCRVAEKKSDLALLARAETMIDTLPESSRIDKANSIIDYYARQGDRATVERLINKYYADPSKHREKLLSSALLLSEHGCVVDDIVMAEYQTDFSDRESLIEGLVKIGRISEATELLSGSPEEDSPDFIKAAGLAAARLGDIPNTQAMLQLLSTKIVRAVGAGRRYNEVNFQTDQDDINGEVALQYVERPHSASERTALVAHFKEPIALGVKKLIHETVANPYKQVNFLIRLGDSLAKHGANPNFGGVVDAAEHIMQTNPKTFQTDDIIALELATAKQLAELSFSSNSHPDILVRDVQVYLKKAEKLLETANLEPINLAYYREEAWVVQAKLAAGLGQQARTLLGSGHKTKARITSQLRKAETSPAARSFLQALQPN